MNIVTAASLDARTRLFSDLSLKVKLIRGRKGRIKLGLAMGKYGLGDYQGEGNNQTKKSKDWP